MRNVRTILIATLLAIAFGVSPSLNSNSAHAEVMTQIRTANEYYGGYDRNLFKHWIDADKNGCDTRKEVLIAEAIIKPKKGAKCALTVGKWTSAYDGISYTKD